MSHKSDSTSPIGGGRKSATRIFGRGRAGGDGPTRSAARFDLPARGEVKSLLLALCVAAILPFAAPARADEADGIDCDHAMAQQEMNICADKDYRTADKVLNDAYRKAMADLDAHSKDLLRASQREWIKFRDAECTYQSAQNEGGSIYPLVYSGCLTRLTTDRTKQLGAGQQ